MLLDYHMFVAYVGVYSDLEWLLVNRRTALIRCCGKATEAPDLQPLITPQIPSSRSSTVNPVELLHSLTRSNS